MPEKATASPLRSLRSFCLECQGGSIPFIRECNDDTCALRPWRLPDAGIPQKESPETTTHDAPADRADRALRGIRRHCLACAGDRRETRACAAQECPLWPYRFGVTPATWWRVTRRAHAPKTLRLPGF